MRTLHTYEHMLIQLYMHYVDKCGHNLPFTQTNEIDLLTGAHSSRCSHAIPTYNHVVIQLYMHNFDIYIQTHSPI